MMETIKHEVPRRSLRVGDLVKCDDQMCLVLNVSKRAPVTPPEIWSFEGDEVKSIKSFRKIEVMNLESNEVEVLSQMAYAHASSYGWLNIESGWMVDVSFV